MLRNALIALGACAIFAAAQPAPRAAAADVSLEAMIGQMIMVGFVGTGPGDPWPEKLVGQIAGGEVGGVLFLKRNVTDRQSVRALNAAFLAAGGATPPLLAVDQEGGIVQRLTAGAGFAERPSARDVARTETPAEANETYAGMARDLRDWGFNLNLGPVVDVDVNPANPIIGALGRSFSADPEAVAQYAAAFVAGHRREGVLTALKHFPGHGSSRDDSHKGFVDITATWTPVELVPYRRLIAEGLADIVMPGHLYLEQMTDPGGRLPSSLSRTAQDVLRNDLGFAGVIISDDMEMQAIEADYTLEEAAVDAIRAGTNILIYSNYAHQRPDLPRELAAILVRRAGEDAELRRLVADSYRRIMALKAGIAASETGAAR
ncbi:MAG: glycoside hydrolase family 3 protein [Rhizobiales bacterium]|nr:glycoside hydrolase family 3 protein [Hyphomicrobiales bacterium]